MPDHDRPSEGLDLAALREAEEAVEDAAARRFAEAALARLAPRLAVLDPALRDLAELFAGEVGRAAARAEAARQAALSLRRERGAWIALDPLRATEPDRADPPPPPPDRAELLPDDPAFQGHGWNPPERSATDRWRWSRPGPCAALLLPGLGGPVTLTLELVAPFGLRLEEEDVSVLVNGEPLEGVRAAASGSRLSVSGRHDAPGDGVAGRLGVVVIGPSYARPGGDGTPVLGLGFRRAVVERLNDP